jgi:uncharacterized protein
MSSVQTVHSNVETVQAIYGAFGRGDVPFILGQLADDVSWDQELPSYGVDYIEPGRGLDHVKKFFATVSETLEFKDFQPLNFLGGGDQVAAIIGVDLLNKRTGRTLQDLEVHVWTFGADGKVVGFTHVADRHAHVCAWRDLDV